jgi:hypothetical protein
MIQSNTITARGRLTVGCAFTTLAVLALAGSLSAQTMITADQVACIPVREHAVIWATVSGNQPSATVRLYFRRLNDVVEDFYFVNMIPSAEPGRYWGILPKPEKREPDRHEISRQRDEIVEANKWAVWWREKEASVDRNPTGDLDDDKIRERASRGKLISRHWMNRLSNEEFEKWLEGLKYEPTDYFVAVVGTSAQIIAQTPMMVVEVRSQSSCKVELSPEQQGEAANLVVGETAPWQVGEPVFHWMCDGVVTRIGENNVKRADESCRVCVPCISQAAILTNAQGQGVTSPSDFD